MNLFTCKKYVFLIEKNFPNLTTPPKNRKNSTQRFSQLNASLCRSRCGITTRTYE
ncbi:Hypothetical protein G436_3160 [Leptospira interrogans serovar Hardjo str. Norma]|uniref:Uncharacterized protein n=1 Tax=Leptospira interrogans serovar Hardjo str. Norma TaxID=1279460 RepID=A0A0M4N756_LEPIR|nr:Hypothetical protein G436_3160 [Leptospira interrogans serovar Hardjo str. Norma]